MSVTVRVPGLSDSESAGRRTGTPARRFNLKKLRLNETRIRGPGQLLSRLGALATCQVTDTKSGSDSERPDVARLQSQVDLPVNSESASELGISEPGQARALEEPETDSMSQ